AACDIEDLRKIMDTLGVQIPIIAKIEKSEAIDYLDEICDACDGMMVARGDLGIDMPTHLIPFLQKRIIRTCNEASKPVITATQMLQSMTEHPYPTRAEATDVANAILDGTDAVMLSAESATGKFPVESVKMMRSIANMAESEFPYHDWNRRRTEILYNQIHETADAISNATCGIAWILSVDGIVTTTVSGYTARQVARWRPQQHIIALSPSEKTCRQLSLVWGVSATPVATFGTIDDMINHVAHSLREQDFAIGERIVITAGVPFGKTGLTNMVQVHTFTEEDFND
ncbi:MAG TPA: pyruvate kinase, partial [Anaerolineae bacterium]|nr:pyruvate kinase [Anaerolineae bacterium]